MFEFLGSVLVLYIFFRVLRGLFRLLFVHPAKNHRRALRRFQENPTIANERALVRSLDRLERFNKISDEN